jgi:hypothetical protein
MFVIEDDERQQETLEDMHKKVKYVIRKFHPYM